MVRFFLLSTMLLKNKSLFIVQLSFILCQILSSNLADSQSSMLYNILSDRHLILEPNSIRAEVKLLTTLYIKSVESDEMAFVVGLPHSNFVVKIGNTTINLLECSQTEDLAKSLKTAFKLTYTDDGIINQILIDKNDDDLVKNLKIMFAYYMQNQIMGLLPNLKQDVLVETTEPTQYGSNCSVAYDFDRYELPFNSEEVLVSKTFEDMKVCLQKNGNDVLVSDEEYFSNNCASTSEEEYQWQSLNVQGVELVENSLFQHYFNVTDRISYKPFKNEPTTIKLFHNALGFVKLAPQEYEVHDLDESNAQVYKDLILSDLNEAILNNTDSNNDKDLEDLIKLYKALSCSSVDPNISIQAIEAAIICKS